MWMFADYKYEKCAYVEYQVGVQRTMNQPWPKKKCPKCETNTFIRLISVPYTQVPEGKLGNAKNGYTNNICNHSSSLLPKKSSWSDIDKNGNLHSQTK